MHCEAIVFGDHPQRLMGSLIETAGRMPDDVRVPLELSEADGCSGWHIVNSGDRQFGNRSAFAYGNWVHCVWPTAFLRDHLGPHALLDDRALSSLEIPRHHVQKQDGQWWARIPRFFRTVGVHWSMVLSASRWQGHGSDDAAQGATVGGLDLEYNLTTHDPNLIVGPTGPVFYQDPDAEGHNVTQRRFEAALPLMELPPTTPVTLVSWHDKEEFRDDPYVSRPGTAPCTCLDTGRDRPYRNARPWDY